MAQTTINVRMDTDLKKEIENIFEQMGMNTTTAFNVFARAVAQTRKIPFEIVAPEGDNLDKFFAEMEPSKEIIEEMEKYATYEDYVEAMLEEADEEEENNPNDTRDFEEVMKEMRVKINAAKQKI